jgi:SAM-dependent methyltransferase
VGISDRHHFAWLVGALSTFEEKTGRLRAMRDPSRTPTIYALAARRRDPVIDWLATTLGAEAEVVLFDKFAESAAGVEKLDINALDALPENACDVLTLLRASYFIAEPAQFLAEARRIVRPGGLVVVDWLHGLSQAPVLDLRGDPRYDAKGTPFMTTYADAQLVSEFAGEFEALIRHVNRPPSWVNAERPGARVPLGDRVQRLLGRGPRGDLTVATYLHRCRDALARAGKHLVEPPVMERYFNVVFRHARYFYPHVRKFNLYVLTVLAPVGK